MGRSPLTLAALSLLFPVALWGQIPGQPDLTFAPSDIGFGRGDGVGPGQVVCVALGTGNKVFVGGNFTGYFGIAPGASSRKNIARLDANGVVDATFDTSNGPNGGVYKIAALPSGGCVIVGGFTQVEGVARIGIARLTNTGALDATFTVGSGLSGLLVNSLAVQPDGKVLVGGSFTSYNGASCGRIVRLNTDGSLDATFVTGTGFDAGVTDIAVQSNGMILMGGTFTSYNGNACLGFVRLQTNGQRDATYAPALGEKVLMVELNAFDAAYVRLQFGGLKRLSSTGAIDAAYVATTISGTVTDMDLDASNRLVFALSAGTGGTGGSIVRVAAGGGLDATFNTGTGFGGLVGPSSLQVQSDGKIVAGGNFRQFGNATRNGILRLLTTGSLDAAFHQGYGFTAWFGVSNTVECIARQPDGKLIVGGAFDSHNDVRTPNLIRLTADGAPDATFSMGAGPSAGVRAIALQTDGSVLIGGTFTAYNGTAVGGIARVQSSGAIDAGFAVGGVGAGGGIVQAITVQSNGKILVGGSFSTFHGAALPGLVRLNTDGTLDGSFNANLGGAPSVQDIAILSDGSMLICGSAMTVGGVARNGIARLTSTGVLDPSFDPGSGIGTPFTYIEDIVVRPDGKYFVSGSFSQYNAVARTGVALIDGNGVLDPSFVPPVLGVGSLRDMALQANGKLVVCGELFNGSHNGFIRLHATGAVDESFSADVDPFNGRAGRAVLELPSGQFIIGGAFYAINGVGRNRLARISGGDPYLSVSPRVQLGGAYGTGPLQSDALRSLSLLPLGEPYSAAGYAHAGGGGGEQALPAVLIPSGNDAVVDWVTVELRSSTTPATILATRSAFVQSDGDVVLPDGVSHIRFDALPGNYHIAVRHRNHLGVMTAAPITLSSSTTTIDFTNPATPTYGTNAQNNVSGTMVLWPGDVNFDGTVRYVGATNDRDFILSAIGGSVPTNVVSNVYSPLDVNMDGSIRYVGANNDRDIILQTVGGSVPTATRVQQLP